MHDPCQLEKEARPFALQPRALPSDGEVLAGEAAAHHVRPGQIPLAARPNILMAGDGRPMPFEDATSLRVDLDLPEAFHPGFPKAQVKAADPGEQASERQHRFAL